MEQDIRAVDSNATSSDPGTADDRRVRRFYDRIRSSIERALSSRSAALGKAGEYLLLAPDVFILLWRLSRDPRVNGQHKMLLGTGIAYYLLPLDLMPEALIGPIGLVDDLVLGVYILNTLISDTDEAIIREHWSGTQDVLSMIRGVLANADGMVASNVLDKIKKFVQR